MEWDTTSKNKVFSQLVSAVAVIKGYVDFVIYKCCKIFHVILQLTSVILDHMQKPKIMEGIIYIYICIYIIEDYRRHLKNVSSNL